MHHHKFTYRVGNSKRSIRGNVLIERRRKFIQMAEYMRLAYIVEASNTLPLELVYNRDSVLSKRCIKCTSVKWKGTLYQRRRSLLVMNDYDSRCFYRRFIKNFNSNNGAVKLKFLLRLHHISENSIALADMIHLSYSDLEASYQKVNDYLLMRGYDIRQLRYNQPGLWRRLWNYLTFQKSA